MKTEYKEIVELIGKTLVSVEHNENEVVFLTDTSERFILDHDQDCCEYVHVDKIEGNLDDILNSPIISAKEEIGHDDNASEYESITLTDYILKTSKGKVKIKWNGSSNGYYSESVYFKQILD